MWPKPTFTLQPTLPALGIKPITVNHTKSHPSKKISSNWRSGEVPAAPQGCFRGRKLPGVKTLEENYHGTEEALVRAGEFDLCGRYIKGEERFTQIRKLYRVNLRLSRDPEIGADHAEFARVSFSEKTLRLVALLVRNGREQEAKKIVARAKRIWPDKSFAKKLGLALRGQFDGPA